MISQRKLAFLPGWGRGPASVVDFDGFSGLGRRPSRFSSSFRSGWRRAPAARADERIRSIRPGRADGRGRAFRHRALAAGARARPVAAGLPHRALVARPSRFPRRRNRDLGRVSAGGAAVLSSGRKRARLARRVGGRDGRFLRRRLARRAADDSPRRSGARRARRRRDAAVGRRRDRNLGVPLSPWRAPWSPSYGPPICSISWTAMTGSPP